jgi:hypothetical protein
MLSLLLATLPVPVTSDAPAPAPLLPRSELVGVLPRGLTSFGCDALDGWLYVLGGYHGKPHAYSRAGQSGEFYRVHVRDPRVLELLDGPGPMQSAPLLACDGVLLRAGGLVARNAAGEPALLESLASAAAFDPVARAWKELPPLPQARSSHDLELVGRRVFAVGGWNIAGKTPGAFATTLAELDLDAPETGWTEVAAPFRARALAAVRLGARLAAIGGMDADGEVVADVRVFDPAQRTWSAGPAFPGEAFGLSAASIGGVVHACGKDGVVWRLAEGASEWTRAGSLAFPRFFHQLVADGAGGLLALGGIDEMRSAGRVRPIERFAGEYRSVPRVSTITLPAPFPARNRQGALVRGDTLFLFGGNTSLGQHDFEPENFARATWSLDLATLAWRERAPFPEGRQTIAASLSADEKTGFAIGGFAHDGDEAVSRGAGFRYDLEADAWSADARLALDVPRTQTGLVRRDGALWVLGGVDYDPRREGQEWNLPLDVLVLADGAERFVPSGARLTTPRRAFACAELDGRAYLVGGMREEFALVDECEAFDLATRRFVPIAKPRATRVSASLVTFGGKLYLAGGSSRAADGKLRPDPAIEVYDPAADRWSVHVDALPEPMEHLQAFALRDRLLLVSAHVSGPPALRLAYVNP